MRRSRLLHTAVMALVGILVLVLAGCDIDLAGLNALDAYADQIAEAAVVDSVAVDGAAADGLEIAVGEQGNAMAFDRHGTRIAVDNNPVVRWRSTLPDAVAVAVDGKLYAGTVADTAWIVAEGAKGSADSVQVWSY